MELKTRTYFNWSSGKDASLALYLLQKDPRFNVDRLFTSVNSHHDRVSMHGLRRELLEKQTVEIGLPLTTLELPEEPTMDVYNEKMEEALRSFEGEGYSHCGFGDIFLEDLRTYRENQMNAYNIKCSFPLWKKNTKELIHEFLKLGFKSIVICIKSDLLDESFVGRIIDENFINDLPENVDPCGEHGEFHTFCFDGPIFSNPVKFNLGEKVFREYKNPNQDEKKSMGFWFLDLIPVEN